MRSLFRYLLNNYGFFLFLILEIIALVFVFNFNNYQKARFFNSANRITGSVYNTYNSVINYFELARINQELASENAKLRSVSQSASYNNLLPDFETPPFIPGDSTLFHFISAKIINNSVNKPFNYITLNKGRKDGIKPDQGIIGPEGIVGVVTNVSESYALGISVLNQRWGVSAKLKKNGFLCSLMWDGQDYRFANLLEIPFHVELAMGDTIITSGYSSIFPEGVLIGTIQSFEQPEGENYYHVKVKLAVNFRSVSFVEVIENKSRQEINKLEKLIQND